MFAEDPHSLVEEVVKNETQSDQNPHYWIYLEDNTQHGKREQNRILQMHDCWLRWPVKINGRNPSDQDKKKADEEIQKLVSDPQARQQDRQKIDEDSNKASTLLKILPDAFLFTDAGRVGQRLKLRFRPNPKYNPSSNEAKVFHNMAGFLLIDPKEKRLAEISGKLIQDVGFFGGILGKLRKGGTFAVIQTEVAAQDWEVTTLDVHITGKALFFHTISEQQRECMTNFKPVPDGISLKDAAALVEKPQPGQRSQ